MTCESLSHKPKIFQTKKALASTSIFEQTINSPQISAKHHQRRLRQGDFPTKCPFPRKNLANHVSLTNTGNAPQGYAQRKKRPFGVYGLVAANISCMCIPRSTGNQTAKKIWRLKDKRRFKQKNLFTLLVMFSWNHAAQLQFLLCGLTYDEDPY